MSFAPKHILVPVAIDPAEDFHLAEHAVVAACDIAEKFSCRITLMHLSPSLVLGGGPGVDLSGNTYRSLRSILETRLAHGKLKLSELEQEIAKRGIVVESKIVNGVEKTAAVILDAAKEFNTDLLVMCSHGRHGLSRLLFGSVTLEVAEKSDVPILLLHPGSKS